ncbi:MAG: hypothetical protein IIA75_03215, partial [Proteobacteria bacterium]|nr:hypothetical protein [Pseudomonadota bacterium]
MLRMLEGRAGIEAGQLMLAMPLIRLQAKRGKGEPVVVLPGFMADDNSTFILRLFLRSIGYKAYPSFGAAAGSKMLVMLYDFESGELLACLEAGRLGQIRTGAATGLATRYMARDQAVTVGVIGTGFQARTQLEAVCAVR